MCLFVSFSYQLFHLLLRKYINITNMSRIRIDPATIEAAVKAVSEAEEEEVTARSVLTEIEERINLIRWAHEQSNYEYHSSTSASGLYMTAYGSSRRHLAKCNANMDRKEAIDKKFHENLADAQTDREGAEKKHDRAVEKLRQAKEQLCRAQRGF